jgi:hypothetical protein
MEKSPDGVLLVVDQLLYFHHVEVRGGLRGCVSAVNGLDHDHGSVPVHVHGHGHGVDHVDGNDSRRRSRCDQGNRPKTLAAVVDGFRDRP